MTRSALFRYTVLVRTR